MLFDVYFCWQALHAKLAMLLLTVIAEDESLMDCMHDAKFAFKPPIVTHRKVKLCLCVFFNVVLCVGSQLMRLWLSAVKNGADCSR